MQPVNPMAMLGGMIGGAFGGGKGAAIAIAGIGGIASLIGGMLSAPAPGPIPDQRPHNPQPSTPQHMAVAPSGNPHAQAPRNKEGIEDHSPHAAHPTAAAEMAGLYPKLATLYSNMA
jgi:predicted lipid-binding transport protein (Tim44 family)